MANPSYVTSLTRRLGQETATVWREVFDYVLRDVAFGRVTHRTRAENLRGHFYESTTPSTANDEFSIAHGKGTAPLMAIPVVSVASSGAQLVPLTVSRAADSDRVYFRSPTTSAVVQFYLE